MKKNKMLWVAAIVAAMMVSCGGGGRPTFGDNEFVEYFKEYLRPQIQELLF